MNERARGHHHNDDHYRNKHHHEYLGISGTQSDRGRQLGVFVGEKVDGKLRGKSQTREDLLYHGYGV